MFPLSEKTKFILRFTKNLKTKRAAFVARFSYKKQIEHITKESP